MHFGFNLGKVFGRKRFLAGKVVVETVFDRRSDRDLNVGPQLFDRFRHHVRAGVAENGKSFLILGGDNGYGGVGGDGRGQILQFIVNLHR